jgi:hypothetical protein
VRHDCASPPKPFSYFFVSGGGAARTSAEPIKTKEEMIMKTLIASALVALGLLSTTLSAQAAYPGSPYTGYPDWAKNAFENYGG